MYLASFQKVRSVPKATLLESVAPTLTRNCVASPNKMDCFGKYKVSSIDVDKIYGLLKFLAEKTSIFT